MRNPILVILAFALAAVPAAVSCSIGGSGSSGTETSGSGGQGGSAVAACSSADFEAQVIAFCKTENPSSPAAGEMGASCVDSTQCSSDYCLEPFGNSAYCTVLCPNGNECPIGYSCQDTGTLDGAACYQDVCIYGGSDAADCTANLLSELDSACNSECKAARAHAWMDCLAGAGRLCGSEDAAEKCGVERGLLESCCNGCDSFNW